MFRRDGLPEWGIASAAFGQPVKPGPVDRIEKSLAFVFDFCLYLIFNNSKNQTMTSHSKNALIGLASILSTSLLIAEETVEAPSRAPNLIVIMADDLGYGDVGINGGKEIPTPHIDRLAREGVQFTDAYVSYSVCGPSRAGFITGRYQQRFGFERNPAWKPNDPSVGLPLEESTLAEALRPAGYRSAVIGKWHLGAHDQFHPLNRGFDEFFGHLGGGLRYFPEDLYIRDYKEARNEPESYVTWIVRNHEPVRTTRYLTEEFTHEATEFIRRQKDGAPFFLFLSYNAPHAPMQAPADEIARFKHIEDEKRRIYAAMVSVLDQGVGEITALLDELELSENTLLFFLSDNGGPTHSNASNNSPLRGTKGKVFEGGFRVPIVARWSGVLPAGTQVSEPVSSLDIFGTIAALNDLGENPDRPLDGVNLMPFMLNERSGAPHSRIYLRMFDTGAFAYRENDFKVLRVKQDAPPRLFNLAEDISESKNLAGWSEQRVSAMLQNYEVWNSELMKPQFEGLDMNEWRHPKVRPPAQFE